MSRRVESGTYPFGVNCAANGSRGALRPSAASPAPWPAPGRSWTQPGCLVPC